MNVSFERFVTETTPGGQRKRRAVSSRVVETDLALTRL
jgi:hypothetical protein